MTGFTLALAGFAALHLGVAGTGVRAWLIGRLGEWPYRLVFALASLALLAALIQGFAAMRADPFDPMNDLLWRPPGWLRWPAYSVILAGFLLAGGALAARLRRAAPGGDPVRGILRITRHPLLWGVTLWGGGHLLLSGARFAPMLFGVLALMGVYGARSIDRKMRVRGEHEWAGLAAVTSNVPFAAIAAGRNRFVLRELWAGIVLGVAAFVAMGVFHGALIGKPAF